MSRILSIGLIGLYLLSTTGVVVHYHFCCGKLAGITLMDAPDRCCGHDIPDHPTVQHKCCSFGEVVVKVSEDQRTPSVFKHFQLVLPAIKTERQTEPAVGCEVHNNICLGEDPPPLPRIYARLSEFVFYG